MKKEMKWIWIGLALSAQTILAGSYDDVADYRNLTVENLPHMQVLVQEAIDHTTSGRMDVSKMKKRIRWSSLLPIVEVRYGQNETQQYEYGNVTLQDKRNWPYATNTGNTYDMTGERTYNTQRGQTSKWQPFWNVTLQWELSKFFFSHDRTYSRYIKEQQMYYQQRVVKEVIKLYQELERLIGLRGADEDIMLEIDISAVAVKLDFISGDYLSSVIRTTTVMEHADAAIAGKSGPMELTQESEEMSKFVHELNADAAAFEARVVN